MQRTLLTIGEKVELARHIFATQDLGGLDVSKVMKSLENDEPLLNADELTMLIYNSIRDFNCLEDIQQQMEYHMYEMQKAFKSINRFELKRNEITLMINDVDGFEVIERGGVATVYLNEEIVCVVKDVDLSFVPVGATDEERLAVENRFDASEAKVVEHIWETFDFETCLVIK